jgi:hypothetical protein
MQSERISDQNIKIAIFKVITDRDRRELLKFLKGVNLESGGCNRLIPAGKEAAISSKSIDSSREWCEKGSTTTR